MPASLRKFIKKNELTQTFNQHLTRKYVLPGRRLHKEPYCCLVHVLKTLCFLLFVPLEFVELEEEAIPELRCRTCKAQTELTIEQPNLEWQCAELSNSKTQHAMQEVKLNYWSDCDSYFPGSLRAHFLCHFDFHSHFVHPLNLKPFLPSHHQDFRINSMFIRIHVVKMFFISSSSLP